MKENVLKTKSFEFAIRIVKLYKYLKKEHGEHNILNNWLGVALQLER